MEEGIKTSRQTRRFVGKTLKPRNPHIESGILSKGGAHEGGKGKAKQAEKRAMMRSLDEGE